MIVSHKKISMPYRGGSAQRQKGLTLIELLVSMTIALIVLAGVVQMMVDNKSKFRLADELAFIQENARYAVDKLGRELRMAGYSGCGASANVANVVNGAGNFYNGFGLEGWDESESLTEFPSEFRNDMWGAAGWSNTDPTQSDAFIVRYANGDSAIGIDSTAPNTNASAVIKVLNAHDVQKGAIMVAVNSSCAQVSVFQYTGTNTSNNQEQFVHNTGSSTSPGNCTKKLFGTGDCSNDSGLDTKDFGSGGSVIEFGANAYYIGPSSIDASIPSLYREKIQAVSGSVSSVSEELLIGVENMQVTYGIDTDTPADGQVNRYVRADQVTDWNMVGSARIELLLRSLNNVWSDDTTFTFKGTDYTDRLLRQKVTSTVLLRNMSLIQ